MADEESEELGAEETAEAVRHGKEAVNSAVDGISGNPDAIATSALNVSGSLLKPMSGAAGNEGFSKGVDAVGGMVGVAAAAAVIGEKAATGDVAGALGGAAGALGAVGQVVGKSGLDAAGSLIGAAAGLVGAAAEMAKEITQALGRAGHESLGNVEYEITFSNLTGSSRNETDTWRVASVEISEALNAPYRIWLELTTQDLHADPFGLVGANARLRIDRPPCGRTIHGIVLQAGTLDYDETHGRESMSCRIEIVPALALLRQRVDTRIFQGMTSIAILEKVLGDGLKEYGRTVDMSLLKSDPNNNTLRNDFITREYVLQYQESDFDFACRLMEEEGLIFHFDHPADSEDEPLERMLVLDANNDLPVVHTFDQNPVPYEKRTPRIGKLPWEPVHEFHGVMQTVPTKVSIADYDWTCPSLRLIDHMEESDAYQRSREIYDLAQEITLGSYSDKTQKYGNNSLEKQLYVRRLRQARDARTFYGSGLVTGFRPGGVFELTGHPQTELNGKYLVTSVDHHGRREREAADQREIYSNDFECIPYDVEFVPSRTRVKPRIHSVQSARVVGPLSDTGECTDDIYTDEHGRVKVQFHWDRVAKYGDPQKKRRDAKGRVNDLYDGTQAPAKALAPEHSSCWLRVGQTWSGAGWGTFFIPRVGMEVLVSFLDGDPDRPLITGSVYNGANSLPYGLPEHKTRSTIKSRSSPNAQGSNELHFEDKRDKEEIYIHAQRDFREEVLNDHKTTVNHDRILDVTNDRTKTIGQNEAARVKGRRKDTVEKDEEVERLGNRITTINKQETVRVKGSRDSTITHDDILKVLKKREVHVKEGEKIEITADKKETITGVYELRTDERYDLTQGDSVLTLEKNDVTLSGGADIAVLANGKLYLSSVNKTATLVGHQQTQIRVGDGQVSLNLKEDGKLVISADTEIVLQVGTTSLSLTKEGAKLKGVQLGMTADTAIELKGAIMREN